MDLIVVVLEKVLIHEDEYDNNQIKSTANALRPRMNLCQNNAISSAKGTPG